MKKLIFSIVLMVSMGAVSFGQDKFPLPKQTIAGLEKPVPLGELVTLSLKSDDDKPVPDLVSTAVTWKVLEYNKKTGGMDTKSIAETDGKVYFGAGVEAKKLTIVASVTNLFMTKVKDKDGNDKLGEVGTRTRLLVGELTLGDPKAPEPVVPVPTIPDLPVGKYDLGNYTVKNVLATFPKSDKRDRGAKILADSVIGVVSQINAGTLKDATQILKTLNTENNKALADASLDKNDWLPFVSLLEEKLYGLYKEGKLNSIADYKTAFEELAAGFAKVATK